MTDVPKTSRVGRGNGRNNNGSQTTHMSKKGYKSSNETAEVDDDSHLCVICAEQIIYASFTPCNHKTCHKCSLRQRVLYEKDLCLICRTPNESLIISDDVDKEFNDFSSSELKVFNEKYKIYYTSQLISDKCMELMQYKCSVKGCQEIFDTFKELQEHTKQAHNKYFCLICFNNKKAFISELALYHYKSLQTHQTVGDKDGFLGHPACKHCIKKRFYSEDELNIHIRDNHERCHICDQDHPATADYYKNYDELYNHFKYDHYVCTVQSCLDKKFVVFREDLDLTAHMLKEHGSLTGGNKIVIGSGNGRSFQSQLSTYQSNTRRNNRAGTTEEADSFDLKKKRLEERAKHYLHNDNNKMKQFLDINNSFKSNKISGEEVANSYKKLFTDQNSEDIVILLTEFSELFPESTSKQKALNDSISFISKTAKDTDFPILGGRAQSPTLNLHGWGSGGSSTKGQSADKFPVLGKPSNNVPKVPTNQKIRYTTVVKQQPKVKPVVTQQANINYRPNYLEPKTQSASTLASSGSSSTSLSSMNSKSGAADSKFPPLEKKTIKKAFPRVNPVAASSSLKWGASTVLAPPKKDEDDWGNILVKDKRKQKKKL